MEFRLLGPLEVVDGGSALELGGQKQRALLALLALEANRPVSRERLIDALWGDEPTATARKALQVYVLQLRKMLGRDRVLTQPTGYLLRADPDEFDVARFQRLYADGRSREALALWRGPPLFEFAQEPFAQPEVARLEELYLACLEARLESDLAEGRHAEVASELEALVRSHPLRERLRELLLLALYRSGRQADALAAYQDARHTLVEELGIEPGKPLRDLHQAILRQDTSLDLSRAEPVESGRGPFVGRTGELTQLLAGLEDAFAGRGRLFLLVGEPGIGKSRLAEELIQQAHARRARVLVGRCWEASGAPAYWPWVQALRGHAEDAPPELAALLRGEPVAAESESARFRLFDATARFSAQLSRERPLLLFLDDLHAADEPSLLLLRFLARELASMRLLMVGACRDVDPVPGRGLSTMLAEVAREPVTARIGLRGLSEEAVADYVEAELASRDLAATLYESTEGNPLFLGETVRLLAVEGRMVIPESVRDVIARRLAHLSDECNDVLMHASVLGREFTLDALARMSGRTADELLDTLEEAGAARILSDAPGGLRFAHILVRDVLYETLLTTPRRVRLHRLAIDALEVLYGRESGPHLAELAHHAIAGSDFEKALVCAQRAGDRALDLLAYEEAARLYHVAIEALELARPGDERKLCELLIRRGEAHSRAGATAAARELFLEAAAIARRLDLARELGHAALGYGGRIVWRRASGDPQLVPLLEEALATLGGNEPALQARLLARLAGALRDEPSRERRDALSAEAVEVARASGDAAAVAYALEGRGYAILGPDTFCECLSIATEMREAAERAGDAERVIGGHLLRSMAHLALGNVPAAEADSTAAVRLARDLRLRARLSQALGDNAMLSIARGRLLEAEELIAQAYTSGEYAQSEIAVPVFRCQRYALQDLRGDLAGIEREIAELVADYPARPVFRSILAHLHARLGRFEDAEPALAELAQTLPFDQEWLFGMSLLAETAALLSDAETAAVLYHALLP